MDVVDDDVDDRFIDRYTKVLRRGSKAVIKFCPDNSPSSIDHNNPNLGSLLVDVTQSLIHSVHQLIDDVLVHDTIRRDRCGELREGPLTEHELIGRLRTSM